MNRSTGSGRVSFWPYVPLPEASVNALGAELLWELRDCALSMGLEDLLLPLEPYGDPLIPQCLIPGSAGMNEKLICSRMEARWSRGQKTAMAPTGLFGSRLAPAGWVS